MPIKKNIIILIPWGFSFPYSWRGTKTIPIHYYLHFTCMYITHTNIKPFLNTIFRYFSLIIRTRKNKNLICEKKKKKKKEMSTASFSSLASLTSLGSTQALTPMIRLSFLLLLLLFGSRTRILNSNSFFRSGIHRLRWRHRRLSEFFVPEPEGETFTGNKTFKSSYYFKWSWKSIFWFHENDLFWFGSVRKWRWERIWNRWEFRLRFRSESLSSFFKLATDTWTLGNNT